MTELERLESQLKRSFEGPAWHGPSVLESLEGLTPELNERARSAVLSFDQDLLDRPLCAGVPYTAYTQFIGITQHDLYHAGQIAILRRAMTGG